MKKIDQKLLLNVLPEEGDRRTRRILPQDDILGTWRMMEYSKSLKKKKKSIYIQRVCASRNIPVIIIT